MMASVTINEMMPFEWPTALPVAQVRIARPTARLEKVVRFYRDGLGLEVIGSFQGHAGYSGVMLGLPGSAYHLEFTEHEEGSDCPAPSRDNLLVFYIPDKLAIEHLTQRLNAMGQHAVAPENPYWAERGVTFEDPDGWRVVLMNTAGI
jgi:catechol 2,3-dioxygenase-like lactoylglutathione lyase family enzyme